MAPARRVRHAAEYLLARALLGLFAALPVDRASALGGALGRAVGPRLALSRRARANLARAFPERGDSEREAILAGMWDNLGRVLAEYPHLGRLVARGDDERVEIVGGEHIRALRDDGVGGFCIGGHIGNWEIPPLIAARDGLVTDNVYRALNNPLLDRLLRRLRARPGDGGDYPKGAQAARATVAALRQGRHIGMLVDQKLNEGIVAPFFGRDAMTTTAPARLALRFSAPVLCIRVERLRGARFRFTAQPFALRDSGDPAADAAAATRAINGILEGWIRERPEQWLWLHRRWPREESPAPSPASDLRPGRGRDGPGTS